MKNGFSRLRGIAKVSALGASIFSGGAAQALTGIQRTLNNGSILWRKSFISKIHFIARTLHE